MRIVHVLSQKELTGAEVYALQLGEWCQKEGHHVFIISDELHRKTRIPFFSRPVDKPTLIEKVQNFFWFRKFLKEKEIDVIHCHSRAALRMAHWARLRLPVALVSTVHGVQHFSWSKRIFDIYGEKILAVCENLQRHLRADFKMDSGKIKVIRNPIPFGTDHRLENKTSPDNLSILVVGRTTGPKGQRISQLLRQVVPATLKKYSHLKWEFVGGSIQNLDVGTQGFLRYLQQMYRDRVFFYDKVDNLKDYYERADLVIGAGRVAMEAAVGGKQVLSVGEAGSHGLLTPENMMTAFESNFGDIGDVPMDPEEILLEIDSFFQNRGFYENKWLHLQASIVHETDPELVGRKVIEEYKSAVFKRLCHRWIPILMYHKVVTEELDSPHRTFVTTRQFEKQMATLDKLGFTTVTFKDLADYREGLKPWSTFPKKPVILTFDDGYQNNLIEAVPILKKFRFRATFFLLSDANVDSNVWDHHHDDHQLPLLSAEERKQLVDAGMEVGSHGLRHEKVIQKSDGEVFEEWTTSKEHLEAELGREVVVLAYPFGDSDERLARFAQMSNYVYAVNTDQGAMHIEDDRYQIFRVNVFPEDGPLDMLKKTSKWYRKYYFRRRGR